MSRFQRIKSFIFGVFMLLYALVMMTASKEAYDTIAVIISFSILLYGLRLLWYYFRMARHMVGGKRTLYQAILVLDVGLFTMAVASMSSFIILIYLLGIYAFSGAIDILRAFEAKKNGAASWKLKFLTGCVIVVFAVALVVIGLAAGNTDILVYGYVLSLAYSAIMMIVTAFRKTSIVYIQ